MPHVEYGAHVRMAERGEHSGFPLQPLVQSRIAGYIRGQDFDRDRPLQARVPRLVNSSHPSGLDGSKDFIGTESSAWHERISLRESLSRSRHVTVNGIHCFAVKAQQRLYFGANSRGHLMPRVVLLARR